MECGGPLVVGYINGCVVACKATTAVTIEIFKRGGATPVYTPTAKLEPMGGANWWLYTQNVAPGTYYVRATCSACGLAKKTVNKTVKDKAFVDMPAIKLKPPCTQL